MKITETTDPALCIASRRAFVGFNSATYSLGSEKARFLTITSSGLRKEGEPYLGYYINQAISELKLFEHIRNYVNTVPGHIFWRQTPSGHEVPLYALDAWSGGSTPPRLTPHHLWVGTARLVVVDWLPFLGEQDG